ncbi:hypothetical protein DDB_G0282875 [Dictyostelium discoideum AX4]|uniref:Uncharacterized protein n=1 Tax=Dictyostelium discoideum TaxID=44689 RepID=Q54RW4_DICDI|nr:hypothetical protein DDB_G0282875 [Dictyostelium discoideum AX4]EAL66017.1 hypothetical protein DDB_G0282875 [Dictyostelium discoideum AX4]|eukprot:XP_639373.1 hypothetical protein DDB_G0282875 [Dictyostelium discoideum AX4]
MFRIAKSLRSRLRTFETIKNYDKQKRNEKNQEKFINTAGVTRENLELKIKESENRHILEKFITVIPSNYSPIILNKEQKLKITDNKYKRLPRAQRDQLKLQLQEQSTSFSYINIDEIQQQNDKDDKDDNQIVTLVVEDKEYFVKFNNFAFLADVIKSDVLYLCGLVKDLPTNLNRDSSYLRDTSLLKRFYAFGKNKKRVPSTACAKCLFFNYDKIILESSKNIKEKKSNPKNASKKKQNSRN